MGRPKKFKIGRRCPFEKCQHAWVGDPSKNRCPKCGRYIGPATQEQIQIAMGQAATDGPGAPIAEKPLAETTVSAAPAGSALIEVNQEKKDLQSTAGPQAPTGGTVIPGVFQGPTPQPQLQMRAETLGAVWQSIFGAAAFVTGEPTWNLTQSEKDALGEASKPVAEKYLPELLKEHYEVAVLVVALTATVGGKMALMQQKLKGGKDAGRSNAPAAQPAAV